MELHGESGRHLVPIILILDGFATVDLSPRVLPVVSAGTRPSLNTGFYQDFQDDVNLD